MTAADASHCCRREMLRCMGQAGPDDSPLARKALDWLLEMAHERGTDLAWTGRPDDDELDPTLYSGTAGIVLALLEGYQHFGEDRYAQAAARGARTLAAAVAQEWPLSSLYFGLAGLAFALREVGDMLGDRQAAQAAVSALDLVRSRFDGQRWADQFELLGGNAGIALGAAARAGDLDLAVLAVTPHLATAEPTSGMRVPHREVRRRSPGPVPTTSSHGTLGIVYALAGHRRRRLAGADPDRRGPGAARLDVGARNEAGPDGFRCPALRPAAPAGTDRALQLPLVRTVRPATPRPSGCWPRSPAIPALGQPGVIVQGGGRSCSPGSGVPRGLCGAGFRVAVGPAAAHCRRPCPGLRHPPPCCRVSRIDVLPLARPVPLATADRTPVARSRCASRGRRTGAALRAPSSARSSRNAMPAAPRCRTGARGHGRMRDLASFRRAPLRPRPHRDAPGQAQPPGYASGAFGGPRDLPVPGHPRRDLHRTRGPHLFKIIHPCRRHQRPWAVRLIRPG